MAVARGTIERHRDAERRVDAAQLAEVGQLARARHVTDGREERVLHDRTQQHVRAEARRRLLRLFDQRAGGDTSSSPIDERVALRRIGVRAPSRWKTRRLSGCGSTCGAWPSARHRGARRRRRARRWCLAVRSSRANTSRRERLGRRDRTTRTPPARTGPSDRLDPAGERLGHADAGRGRPRAGRRSTDSVNGGGGRGRRRARRSPGAIRSSSVRAATGSSPAPSGGVERDGARLELRVEHRTRGDLLPVVILRVDPEDRRSPESVAPRRRVARAGSR